MLGTGTVQPCGADCARRRSRRGAGGGAPDRAPPGRAAGAGVRSLAMEPHPRRVRRPRKGSAGPAGYSRRYSAGRFSAKARAPSLASAVSKIGHPRRSSAASPCVSVSSAVS